jgi:hypothetical protein
MAETVRRVPVTGAVEEEIDLVGGQPRISWGAIFAGAVSALGLWMLLYAFGLAVGLTALDPNNPGSLRSSGIFTGVWGLVAPLVALFIGGFVAARGAGIFRRAEGAIHGMVMWGLATVIGSFLVISAAAAVIRGVASVSQAAVRAGGAAIGDASEPGPHAGGAAETPGVDVDDALRPVNERLQATGRPPITADQIVAAAEDAIQRSAGKGRIDHDVLVNSVTHNTALSRADAEEVANRLEMQIDDAKDEVAQRVHSAESGALRAAEASGKAFWGAFGALLLGLVAAMVGGALGVPQLRVRRRELAPARPPAAPAGPPREVYP